MPTHLQNEPRPILAKYRGVFILGVVVLIGFIISAIDFAPSLSHMNLSILSGPKTGQEYALVEKITTVATDRSGNLSNLISKGAVDNLNRLQKAAGSGEGLFALVPDGLQYPQAEKPELVARLPKSDTIFFLGRDANKIRYLSDLKDMHIGIGSQGSSTTLLARQLLGQKDLTGLNLKLSAHTFSNQVEKLITGELDLGVFVTTKDNPLIKQAILKGLQIASFENAEAWVVRFPALHAAPLYAGHYDQVALLPKTDKKVFQVDTLVLGNGNDSRSDVVALLVLLNKTFHGFVGYNLNTPNYSGLVQAKELVTFLDNGGPNFLDEYVPGLVNFMPPANLLHYVVVISLLMNLLTGWNKLRLYRVDSKRIDIEDQIHDLFDTELTLEEFHKIELEENFNTEVDRKTLADLIIQSEKLRQRCRKYAVSFVTPLGQENVYRYHEGLITQQLKVLRDTRERDNAVKA